VREKLIGNWLDSATEKSFQVPFCQMLQAQGHTLLHLTRHSAMELGTDVITIAPDGVPCAYQLKTAKTDRVKLTTWRKEIAAQVDDLVTLDLNHPSLPVDHPHHRSYFVINKDLEEDVWEWIRRKNEGWKRQGTSYSLGTVVRGELLKYAEEASSACWPSELTELRTLLELHLDDGRGLLPKSKLATLLESIHKGTANKEEAKRACASTPLLVSVAIQNYAEQENHVAEIEAWIMAIAYTFREVERLGLEPRYWKGSFDLMWMACENAFGRLVDELMERKHHAEGHVFGEPEVRGARFTSLVGLLSAYGLKKGVTGFSTEERDRFLLDWVTAHSSKMQLWGEGAIPSFLARLWFRREFNRGDLGSLIREITSRNGPRSEASLADPYTEFEEVLLKQLNEDESKRPRRTPRGMGDSWMLEGLVHLYVRSNCKQTMKALWPGVTHIAQWSFAPEQRHDFFSWRTDKGTTHHVIPQRLQRWDDLKKEAWRDEDDWIPKSIRGDPALLLMIMLVFPHRMDSRIMRWLDSKFAS
jgi:hypothetical protein